MKKLLLALLLLTGALSPAWALSPGQRTLVLSSKPAPALDLSFLAGVLDPAITFTRASANATYFDITGTMQTAGTNVPRFDYNPVTLAPNGLMIEEARTNLYLNSATLVTQDVTTTAVPYSLTFYGTGTVTLTGTSTAGPLVGTGASTRVTLTFTPTAGTLTSTVSGTVTKAQIEAGSFPTSYVATAGAAATRALDVATIPVGTWFVAGVSAAFSADVSMLGSGAYSANRFLMQLDSGTSANRFLLYNPSSGVTVQGFSTVANSSGGTGTALVSLPYGAPYRIGAVYQAALNSYCGNSGTVANTVHALGLPTTLATLRLGSAASGATPIDGYLRRLRYWPRALPAASTCQGAPS